MKLASIGLAARRTAALAGVLACATLAACESSAISHFTVPVDSISAPDVIGPTDTLKVVFHGVIGPDGCWSLESVNKQLTADTLAIVFLGKFEAHSNVSCPQVLALLEHQEVVPPPVHTPFTIIAQQPDGSLLTRVVAAAP